jgi:hypothetical protein
MCGGGIASLGQHTRPDAIEAQRRGKRGLRASNEQRADHPRGRRSRCRVGRCQAEPPFDIVSVSRLGARALRARRATARVEPRFVALVVSMLAVFAGCYAIGRATAANAPSAEGPPSLQAASRSVASPIRLSGVPAIAIAAIPKVSPRRDRELTREIPHTPLLATPVQQLQPALSSGPEAAVSPPSARVPSPAPSGSSRGEGRHSRSSSRSGGRSFDNSS